MLLSYSLLLALVPLISLSTAANIYYYQDGSCKSATHFGCTNIPDSVCCDIPVLRAFSVLFSSMPTKSTGATYASLNGYNCPNNGHSAKLEDQGTESGGSLCLNSAGISVAGAQWLKASGSSKQRRDLDKGMMMTRGSMKANYAAVNGHYFRINHDVPEEATDEIIANALNQTQYEDIPAHLLEHEFEL